LAWKTGQETASNKRRPTSGKNYCDGLISSYTQIE
jgi:hypothetical protein